MENNAKKPEVKETSGIIEKKVILTFLGVAVLIIIVIYLLISLIFNGKNHENDTLISENKINKNSSEMIFTELITPCEWEENRGFYLESDEPIAQKFPGVNEVIIYSGKGKSRIPDGRWKGPIKFFDPSNPDSGHRTFRIYLKN